MADEQSLDIDLETFETITVLAAALVPVATQGYSITGLLGTLSLLGISTVTKGWLGRRLRDRLRALERGMRQQAADLTGLFERIRRVESSSALALLALRSSCDAPTDEQAFANGMLLVDGLAGDRQDEAEFAIRTLSRLSEIELRALQSLQLAREQAHNEGAELLNPENIIGECVQPDLASAVLGSLSGLGLLRLDPPNFGGFELTTLGIRIAVALEVPGDPGRAGGAP